MPYTFVLLKKINVAKMDACNASICTKTHVRFRKVTRMKVGV